MAKKGYLKKKKSPKAKSKPLVDYDKNRDDKKLLKKLQYYQDSIAKAKTLFKNCYDSRKRYDWEWLTRDLYRRGYQFSRYNPSNRTVILSTRQRIKIPVNLVNAQMRVVKNQVTAFKPKWETLPRGTSEEAVTNARYSNKLLDYYYDKLKLANLLKKTVMQGLTYSVGGPWQIGYDPEGDNGNGEIYLWLIDTFDFYVDPHATCMEDAEYCFKAVRTPLNKIKNNPEYEFTEFLQHGENKLAASEYKQFLLQALNYMPYEGEQEDEGAILKEMWLKVRVNEENKDMIIDELKASDQDADKLRDGETVMRVVTYTDLYVNPLKVQTLRRSDFPFVVYHADTEPVAFYGESWIKHLIPMNRVLNQLESSVFEYNYRYAAGRLAVQKNSGVRIISNRHGDIVEYNAGSNPPVAIPLNPLQQSYHLQIENMRRYIEDIGGAHDVSLGRIPTGVKSGVGIAELKSADATNQQDLVDNLSEFLIEVAKKMLNEIAENYDVPKMIKVLGKKGNPNHFAVVGEKGAKNRRNKKEVKIGTDVLDIAVIGKDSEVRVSIGSWLAYTKSAQEEKLKELFQSGIIDQATYLEHAEFSDIEGIIERTRKEEFLKKFRGTPAEQGMPADEEIAEQENYQMVHEGKTPDVEPEDNHDIHLIIHQEALGSQGNPLVEAHMKQHENFIKQGTERQAELLGGMAENIMPAQGEALGGPEGEIPGGMGGLPAQPGMGGLPAPTGMPSPGAAAAVPPEAIEQMLGGLQGVA